jgi:hypothetical protein
VRDCRARGSVESPRPVGVVLLQSAEGNIRNGEKEKSEEVSRLKPLLKRGLELLKDDTRLLLAGHICVSTFEEHATSFDEVRYSGELDLEGGQKASDTVDGPRFTLK